MGSGGFFVQSEKFIEEHGGKLGQISVYGQESNPTTWRLAAMNMAIRGIDFNFGKEPTNSFTQDQHPDLRAERSTRRMEGRQTNRVFDFVEQRYIYNARSSRAR